MKNEGETTEDREREEEMERGTWNQSMVQQLTREGNIRRRVRKASPMGLMASTT